MCLIIDANLAARVFAAPCEDDFLPIWEWIEEGDGKVVFGGRNGEELRRLNRVRRRLLDLWRAGRAMEVPSREVSAEEHRVVALGGCRSNDPHIIALARVSWARVLCTLDRELQADFKNPRLVPRPRGHIYNRRSHSALLNHNGRCPGST